MKRGKKYIESKKIVDTTKFYESEEAIALAIQNAKSNFDETLELHVKLGIDSKKSDQQVRGVVVLPHGTGKKVRVLAICKGEKADEALAAGAEYVGAEEMIQKIQNESWFDYDAVVTTPDMMGLVGRIAKILGPRKLMPNPKTGTVTMDIARAIHEIKAGKVEYRPDKTNVVHMPFGKVSFGQDKLVENFSVIMDALVKAKPATAKGVYLRSVYVSTTMGLGLKVQYKMQ